MRAKTHPLLALTLGALLTGCAGEAPPSAASPATLSPQASALLAHLRPEDPALNDAAIAIAASRDEPAQREARARLLSAAWALTSPAFRAEARWRLQQANARARIEATERELEAQIDRARDERLLAVLAGMAAIGGADVVAYCLALAEDQSAPPQIRQAALRVLVRHVDRRDTAAVARSAALWHRVAVNGPRAPDRSSGSVANAGTVVAGMQGGFRRCYNAALRAEPPDTQGSIRLTAKIGPEGEVISVSPSGASFSAAMVACVVDVVKQARFAPPEGGGATVVIPVTFLFTNP